MKQCQPILNLFIIEYFVQGKVTNKLRNGIIPNYTFDFKMSTVKIKSFTQLQCQTPFAF